jgi:hypothetical protein
MPELLSDLWKFLKARRKWWLLPVVLALLVFGALILLSGGSAVSPFIYTVF